jgi:hypothetical protein
MKSTKVNCNMNTWWTKNFNRMRNCDWFETRPWTWIWFNVCQFGIRFKRNQWNLKIICQPWSIKNLNWRGIVIDSTEELSNAFDSICAKSESGSNGINESDLQSNKHSEHKIWTWRGIAINLREKQYKNEFDSMHVNSEAFF